MPAPIIVSPTIASSGTGPTRRTYRRALAEELGEFAVLTVNATPDSAVTPDAARQVLVTALASDGVPFDRFDGAHVYVCDGDEAGEGRAVLSGTFDGSIGSLLLDRPFSSALESGTEIELTRPLGGKRHLTTKGLNDLVDEGLARCRVLARITLTGNGTYEQSLATYPWIERAEHIRGLYDTFWSAPTDVPTLSPYGFRLVTNGAARTLVTDQSYTTAETFEMEVFVSADRLVSSDSGVTWSYATTPGLQGDLWQAAAPEHWVLAFGAARGLEHLLDLVEHDEMLSDAARDRRLKNLGRRYSKWLEAAKWIKLREFPKLLPDRTASMIRVPSAASWT